jgi:hypothetical protein
MTWRIYGFHNEEDHLVSEFTLDDLFREFLRTSLRLTEEDPVFGEFDMSDIPIEKFGEFISDRLAAHQLHFQVGLTSD